METDSRSDGSSLSAGATGVGRVQGPKDPEISSSRKAVTTPTFWRAQGGNGVFGSGGLPRSRREEDHSSQMQLWSRRDRSLLGADQGAWGEGRGSPQHLSPFTLLLLVVPPMDQTHPES